MVTPDTIKLTSNDSLAVCHRNSFEYLSLSDNRGFIKNLCKTGGNNTVRYLFERSAGIKTETRKILRSELKSGISQPGSVLKTDMAVVILLTAVFLLTIVRASIKNFQPVRRFFQLRGMSDSAPADTVVIFHWQTTLLNLMSFLIISLFAFQSASINNLVPPDINGLLFWTGCLVIIMAGLTLRHFICSLTGNLSGKREAFNEYLIGIYQSYHLTAFMLFILIVGTTYTGIVPLNLYTITGLSIIGLIYLFRVIRLLIIFMNHNISVFYLILYLCALEILPVAILIRYFTDSA